MRAYISRAAGLVVGAVLSLSAGSVFAQDLFKPDPVSLQMERQARSTYIVRLKNDLTSHAVNDRANDIAMRFGGKIRHTYSSTINGFAMTISSVGLANMLRAGGLDIVSVTQDAIAYINGKEDGPGAGKGGGNGNNNETNNTDCSSEAPGSQVLPWGVSLITPIADPNSIGCSVTDIADGSASPPVYKDYGTSDYSVCVVDTGVSRHPDLNVNTDASINATNEKGGDKNGHGTHVAGIIGAIGDNGIGVVGVAPGAEIISVKVLNRRGSAFISDIVEGVDQMADMSSGRVCDIANMSIGLPIKHAALTNAVLCAAAKDEGERNAVGGLSNAVCSEALAAGIIFTIAAGNDEEDSSGHSPADAGEAGPDDGIYVVASVEPKGDDGLQWSWWSDFGQDVDYAQPGWPILSTYLDDGYATMGGTSMAAPHMAGLVLRRMVNFPAKDPRTNDWAQVDTLNRISKSGDEVSIIDASGIGHPDPYIVAKSD